MVATDRFSSPREASDSGTGEHTAATTLSQVVSSGHYLDRYYWLIALSPLSSSSCIHSQLCRNRKGTHRSVD